MSDRFSTAMQRARAEQGPAWDGLSSGARNAAIFQALCRIDSGCMRTGTSADVDLPPCPAAESFIARRGCILAGRRGEQ